MPPKVSVIIPNYNHAKFLPQRIESVLNQTLTNIEVIILDDCSTDNSIEVIEKYASQDPRVSVNYNALNSGNTFIQWAKGMSLASGEYVWIAESDDYADLRLLEVLVGKLEANLEVGLVYCDSWQPDEHNVIQHDKQLYLHWADPQQWNSNFKCSGIELIRQYMSFICVIPNASCVIMRRSVLLEVGSPATSHKLVGDWLYWGRVMAVTDVAYIADKLNYFRHHTNNVRSKINDMKEFSEIAYAVGQMQVYGEPNIVVYNRAMTRFLERWFNIMVYTEAPAGTHLQIYRNFAKAGPKFNSLFNKFIIRILFSNKLSGLKQIIGDKILKRNHIILSRSW